MPAASPPTRLFAAALAGAAVWLVGLHATAGGRDALLRRQHLRPASAATWLAMQPLPGMYNFANRAWKADAVIAWSELDGRANPYGYVNHYPAQVLSFRPGRSNWANRGCPSFLYVESAAHGRRLRTRYRVSRRPDGLHVARSGAEPRCDV